MSAETLELDRLRRLVEEAPQVIEASPKITEPESITVYVSFGNSDDKLSQRHWAAYVQEVRLYVRAIAAEVYGVWMSESSSAYQNGCFAFELATAKRAEAHRRLAKIAASWAQEAITWAEATTTFITPPGAGHNPHTWGGDRG